MALSVFAHFDLSLGFCASDNGATVFGFRTHKCDLIWFFLSKSLFSFRLCSVIHFQSEIVSELVLCGSVCFLLSALLAFAISCYRCCDLQSFHRESIDRMQSDGNCYLYSIIIWNALVGESEQERKRRNIQQIDMGKYHFASHSQQIIVKWKNFFYHYISLWEQ